MEIRYQIKTRNISQKYWFEREGNDFVLKAHNKPTNRYKGALKEAGMLFTESDTPLYEEFLDILKPLSSHGIFRQNWLDICNPTSKKYDEQICSEVIEAITDHASIFGMAFHPKPTAKILKDFGNGMFIPEVAYKTGANGKLKSDVYPREATLRNILLHAHVLYDSLTYTKEQFLEDDVLTTYFNQLGQPQIVAHPAGVSIWVEGYWESVWFSYSIDKRRLHAGYCGYCDAPVIRTKKAGFCDNKCKSAYHNNKNKEVAKAKRIMKKATLGDVLKDPKIANAFKLLEEAIKNDNK